MPEDLEDEGFFLALWLDIRLDPEPLAPLGVGLITLGVLRLLGGIELMLPPLLILVPAFSVWVSAIGWPGRRRRWRRRRSPPFHII